MDYDASSTFCLVRAIPDPLNSFYLPHNKAYFTHLPLNKISRHDREGTPPPPQRVRSCFVLSFDYLPKDVNRAFQFGSDASRCDILLDNPDKIGGISDIQFRLWLDVERESPDRLRIFNMSAKGSGFYDVVQTVQGSFLVASRRAG